MSQLKQDTNTIIIICTQSICRKIIAQRIFQDIFRTASVIHFSYPIKIRANCITQSQIVNKCIKLSGAGANNNISGGCDWTRTNDLFDVNEAL